MYMFRDPRNKEGTLETSVGNKFTSMGGRGPGAWTTPISLEYLEQGLLVSCHDQPGANVYEMIHIGHLVKGGV